MLSITAATLAPAYCRHRPEQTALYAIIEAHYPRFLEAVEYSNGHLPAFVRQEFEDYLKCGLLEHGFLRVKCDGCRHEHLVAFSWPLLRIPAPAALVNPFTSPRRGFCPSCGARRMVKLLHSLSGRIVRLLERRGLLIADAEHPSLEIELGSGLDRLQAASINYCIAIGPHAGRKALTLYSVPALEEETDITLLARLYGFSLHAATVCEAHQRDKLERLCRSLPVHRQGELMRSIKRGCPGALLPSGYRWMIRAA